MTITIYLCGGRKLCKPFLESRELEDLSELSRAYCACGIAKSLGTFVQSFRQRRGVSTDAVRVVARDRELPTFGIACDFFGKMNTDSKIAAERLGDLGAQHSY